MWIRNTGLVFWKSDYSLLNNENKTKKKIDGYELKAHDAIQSIVDGT